MPVSPTDVVLIFLSASADPLGMHMELPPDPGEKVVEELGAAESDWALRPRSCRIAQHMHYIDREIDTVHKQERTPLIRQS